MAITSKQAAARIVKRAMQHVALEIDGMDCRSIASIAEKSRLSEDKATEVKEYAKAFLKPTVDRVTKITAKVDDPAADKANAEEEEASQDEADSEVE